MGLAAAALVLLFGLRERIRLSRRAQASYAGITVLVIVLTVVLIAPARSVVTGAWHRAWSVSAVSGDESISNHLDTWKVAVRIVEDHPVAGTGPETFPEEFPAYSRMVLSASEVRFFDQFRVESPHNQVLAVASGAGIPAAIAYLGVLVGAGCLLWQALRRHRDPNVRTALVGVMAAGLGHFVTDSFMSAEITGSWLFWTMVGAGLGIAMSPSEKRPMATITGSV
jgi:O-antigen ligase